jgi:glutathione S-transferase
MITLYGFSRILPQIVGGTRDLRAQWALEETGLPYQVRGLDFLAGDLKTDEYRALSPFQQIPVIEDDGFVLAESGAVLLYIAEKAGKLVPPTLQGRAQVTRWCFAALNTLEPTFLNLLVLDMMEKDPEIIRKRRPEVAQLAQRFIGGLDLWLASRDYLLGSEFSVADILMTTVLREVRSAHVLDDFRHVSAYRRRCESRPAWTRTLDAYEKRLGVTPGSAR